MEILNTPLRFIAAIACLGFGCGAAAGVPGAVFEHGDILAGAPGEPIQVRTGLLQLELAPGIVASARGGTALQMNSKPAAQGALEFTVLRGSLRIVQTSSEQLVVVGPGRYALTVSDRLSLSRKNAPQVPDYGLRHLDIDYRQGINLADSILLRQNEKLQVDTRSFVQSIFRIFGR